MLSLFIKKLMFSRQFTMNEGNLEILGNKYSAIPVEILNSFDEKQLKALDEEIKKHVASFIKRLSIKKDDFPEVIHDFYNILGLGEFHLIEFDSEKAKVKITEPPEVNCNIMMNIVKSLFSYIYVNDVKIDILKNDTIIEFKVHR